MSTCGFIYERYNGSSWCAATASCRVMPVQRLTPYLTHRWFEESETVRKLFMTGIIIFFQDVEVCCRRRRRRDAAAAALLLLRWHVFLAMRNSCGVVALIRL